MIFISETWSTNNCEFDSYLPSFQLFPLVRPSLSLFRGSGGILLGVKHGLNFNIKRLKSESNVIIWLLIDGKIGDINKLLIGCVYIVPENSDYVPLDALDTIEAELHEYAARYTPEGLLLTGDYNAHTGCLIDHDPTSNAQIDIDSGGESRDVGQRSNRDPRVDARGINLINMCKKLGLYIVNGRKGDDNGIGACTYFKWNGKNLTSSTVDYVLANDVVFDQIEEFSVSFRPESDHLLYFRLVVVLYQIILT